MVLVNHNGENHQFCHHSSIIIENSSKITEKLVFGEFCESSRTEVGFQIRPFVLELWPLPLFLGGVGVLEAYREVTLPEDRNPMRRPSSV